MKTRRQCRTCRSTDIRSEVPQIDHVNLQRLGPVTIAGRDIAGWRLFDSYVCAGCGFTEFYYRM